MRLIGAEYQLLLALDDFIHEGPDAVAFPLGYLDATSNIELVLAECVALLHLTLDDLIGAVVDVASMLLAIWRTLKGVRKPSLMPALREYSYAGRPKQESFAEDLANPVSLNVLVVVLTKGEFAVPMSFGVIQGTPPSQYSETLLFGVPRLTILVASPSLIVGHITTNPECRS